MKIQINSLQALERLIGGDNEIEIEIRNSVVQDFASKHLKSVADSDGFKKRINDISDGIIREAIQKNVITAGLNNRIVNALNESVATVEREVKDESLAKKVQERVDSTINKAVRKIEDEISTAILTKRIDKMVDEKIKQKLGI